MRFPQELQPVKTVLYWQTGLTLVAMIVGGLWVGAQGVVSAAIGGGITVFANAVYALAMFLGSRPQSAGAALTSLLRAEAIKLALVVVLLFLTLAFYKSIHHVVFFVTFFVTVLAFSSALMTGSGKTKQGSPDLDER
ncbi:MAG: ATP synthase subunit I [Proteobacteria bacterium]|nr:ATP synthase subunit I [Pseudomonadota bacterium]MCL2307938.1 ATP synthase subunit I [Pseudomonadota bacterium]